MQKLIKEMLGVFKEAGVAKFTIGFTKDGQMVHLEAEFEKKKEASMETMPKSTERMPTEEELLMWSTPDVEEKDNHPQV